MSLIDAAVREMRKRLPKTEVLETMRDDIGRFGFFIKIERGYYILCAKRSHKGATVSIDREIFDAAKAGEHKIVMYMAKDDTDTDGRFYVFLWRDIENCPEKAINTRNGKEMINFPIRIGVNLDKLLEARHG